MSRSFESVCQIWYNEYATTVRAKNVTPTHDSLNRPISVYCVEHTDRTVSTGWDIRKGQPIDYYRCKIFTCWTFSNSSLTIFCCRLKGLVARIRSRLSSRVQSRTRVSRANLEKIFYFHKGLRSSNFYRSGYTWSIHMRLWSRGHVIGFEESDPCVNDLCTNCLYHTPRSLNGLWQTYWPWDLDPVNYVTKIYISCDYKISPNAKWVQIKTRCHSNLSHKG